MNYRNILLLSIGLTVAVATAYVARSWLTGERARMLAEQTVPAPVEKEAIRILVAKKGLAAGVFLTPGKLEWLAWPADGIAGAYVKEGEKTKSDFAGAVVRSAISAGQPVTDSLIVQPGDRGFLAAVLEPGSRAVSVPVNATTGISGFIFPGDWVDVLMTMRLRDPSGDKKETRYFSRTLLTDIQVLAIDQAVENKDSKAAVAKTATLQVTPKQAEKIAIALQMGDLSLSLHSLGRGGEGAALAQVPSGQASVKPVTGPGARDKSYTLDTDIYSMRGDPRLFGNVSKNAGRSVHVLRGGKAETAKF